MFLRDAISTGKLFVSDKYLIVFFKDKSDYCLQSSSNGK